MKSYGLMQWKIKNHFISPVVSCQKILKKRGSQKEYKGHFLALAAY